MSEEYGSNFVVIEDEDGNEIELEHLDTVVIEDVEYMAFTLADMPEDAEEAELYILRVEEEDNEDILITIEDEAEQEKVYEVLMTKLQSEEE